MTNSSRPSRESWKTPLGTLNVLDILHTVTNKYRLVSAISVRWKQSKKVTTDTGVPKLLNDVSWLIMSNEMMPIYLPEPIALVIKPVYKQRIQPLEKTALN